jgi:Na+/serine symporter
VHINPFWMLIGCMANLGYNALFERDANAQRTATMRGCRRIGLENKRDVRGRERLCD